MMHVDRALGAFVGLAIGDALGAPVEFYPRGRFTPLTDMREGGKFKMRMGEWTDDTAMALCLAESLIEVNGFDPVDQMERYWRWGNEGHHSTRTHAFGVGKTVARALGQYKRTGEPYSGSTDPRSAGNGSIMRLAPVVLYYLQNYDEAIHFARESSRTTHQAPEALECCAVLAHILCKAISGTDKKSDLFSGLSIPEASDRIQSVIHCGYIQKDESEISGSGYVVESLEAALWAFETTHSFESAVLKAANLGDDADTTAAVCGQIAGAYYGYHAIPSTWLDVLFHRDKIELMARTLIRGPRNEL
mgnify:CR=1 FL=1